MPGGRKNVVGVVRRWLLAVGDLGSDVVILAQFGTLVIDSNHMRVRRENDKVGLKIRSRTLKNII